MEKITLRKSNFITSYGAGSIFDFRTDRASISAIVLLFDNWKNSRRITEHRLAKLLNVTDLNYNHKSAEDFVLFHRLHQN